MTNLRKEARGRQCMVRIPGHCTHDPEETVLAHLPGAGMGIKYGTANPVMDLFGAWACSGCHDVVDGRVKTDIPRSILDLYHYEGVIRTQEQLIMEGKVNV